MQEVLEFFRKLFDTADWPPRWQEGNWSSFHGWLHIISDLLIGSAFLAIPLAIFLYVFRRTDSKFAKTYSLFAAIILICGLTYLLDALSFWSPSYRLSSLLRLVTGILSWVTLFHLLRIIPMASALRTHAVLENEIAERKKVEEELKVANQHLNVAQEIARLGHWQWDVITNKITWSDGLYAIFDTRPDGDISYESYLEKIHPEDKELVHHAVQKAFREKMFPAFTHRILFSDGTEKILQARGEVLTDEAGNVIKMIGTAQDITELQSAQQQLMERTQALESSNAELQRFAYVASHDLQEPLRKIMTFSSLLDKELSGSLNEKGRIYMEKIVESSGRMQRLIDDILAFSSLRVSNEAFAPTDLNIVVRQVISDMEVRIETTGATIRVDPLPVIDAIPSQMGQLFQNLISNAIKFRKEAEPPVVTITSKIVGADASRNHAMKDEFMLSMNDVTYNRGREQFVLIEIQDNGIGFEEVYAEKIFEIFQRLHSNRTFAGTGVGLAICKKIADNHHGAITAHSRPQEGTTFRIYLPVSQKNFPAAETRV